jgi:hypothetical protein
VRRGLYDIDWGESEDNSVGSEWCWALVPNLLNQ